MCTHLSILLNQLRCYCWLSPTWDNKHNQSLTKPTFGWTIHHSLYGLVFKVVRSKASYIESNRCRLAWRVLRQLSSATKNHSHGALALGWLATPDLYTNRIIHLCHQFLPYTVHTRVSLTRRTSSSYSATNGWPFYATSPTPQST